MNRTDDFPAVPYELPSCLSYRAEKRLAARERHPQNLRSPLFGTRRRALVRLRRPAVREGRDRKGRCDTMERGSQLLLTSQAKA